MKVTVCFGPVSVVVPCGNGDIPVRDLISQAIVRYRKASNKSNDVPVSVTALRSSDGAILDPDDRLADVVDDREQLAACLSGEQDASGPGARLGMNLRGDGTSASSNSGSPSPDFLHHHHYNLPGHLHHHQPQRKDIEVTGQEAGGGIMSDHHLHLQVRRGSEPALNRISPGPHSGSSAHNAETPRDYKRWSAAPIVDPSASTDSEDEDHRSKLGGGGEAVVRRHASGPRFARSGARVSMQIFGGGSNGNSGSGYRWAEAADNALLSSAVSGSTPVSHLPPDYEETMHRRTRSLRREPVGATSEAVPLSDGLSPLSCSSSSSSASQLVVLPTEGGPLGIHVVPDYSPNGNELGLLVQGIEPGGRIHRDGRISIQDRIVEINSHPLKDVPFHRAQEVFRNALQSRDLRLRIVKPGGSAESRDATDRSSTSEQQQQQQDQLVLSSQSQSTSTSSRVAAISPTRKSSGLGTQHVPGTGRAASALMTVSTRKIGKKLDLELIKGQDGLGFSVTTRDNPAGILCPIYIKNILPKGAAIEDGRLRSGDRLLEVNGIEMTGKSQSEVVALLRNIPTGGLARLLVSRQETEEESSAPQPPSPKLPRQMKPSISSRASEESLLQLPWKQREILTLDIPVHDTEKAGLGISVKGKTTSSGAPGQGGTTDLGIFIKSVLHGGAASRDGRLCTNDQLLHVNGVSLLGRSNTEAMEGLRRAVHQEGPKPGHITLTIARKVLPLKDREAEGQSDDTNGTIRLGLGDNSTSSYDQSGGSSDQSGSTVIFVSGSGTGFSGSDSRERNSIKDRLSVHSDLRNESYYRATHETWNTTQLQESLGSAQHSSSASSSRRQHSQNSPTVHLTPGEVVSIDGDYLPQSRPRPPSMMLMTSNGSSASDATVSSPPWHQQQQQQSRQRSGPTDGRDRPWMADQQPQSPSESSVRSERPSVDSDAPTYASQTSLEDPNMPGFSRDQFGRQSMSEKRHASLDAKSTDTYQRNKKLREERERQKQSEMEQQPQQQQQQQQQSAKENVPPSGRVIRRAVKRRHAHPLVSRLEKDYLTSPTYHRSSPNLYQPDVVSVVRRGAAGPMADRGSRLSMAPSMMTISSSASQSQQRISSVESLFVKPLAPSPAPPYQQRSRFQSHDGRPVYARTPVRDIGPTLGLKKSSSLESLQTVVHEITMQEDQEPGQAGCYGYGHRPSAVRVVRGRGCNESFRAAVDRSYEDGQHPGVNGNKEPMETLDEEAAELNEMMATHRLPSMAADYNVGDLLNNKGEARKSQKKKNGNNAAGLLLRGLGSMFRFGKHRKSAPSSPESSTGPAVDDGGAIITSIQPQQQLHERRPSGPAGRPSDVDRHHVLRRTLPPDERDRAELGRQMALAVARQAAQDEQKRIQQHYQRLVEQQQRQQTQQQHQQIQQQQQQAQQQGQSGDRSQRLHQLRAHHQQQKRQTAETGQRPTVHSPAEQQFESNKPEIVHGRSASYDPYNDVRKPRSRAAVGEPNTLMPIGGVPPPSHYNNNYDDFQINRRQQHYHSQRSARETRTSPPSNGNGHWTGVDRPVSNYFEYESLHIAGHTVALTGPPYKPQQAQQYVAGRRLPQEDVAATYFRRHDRANTGHEYGMVNQGRASQRESVYGASSYGQGNQPQGRPAPLSGSKV